MTVLGPALGNHRGRELHYGVCPEQHHTLLEVVGGEIRCNDCLSTVTPKGTKG